MKKLREIISYGVLAAGEPKYREINDSGGFGVGPIQCLTSKRANSSTHSTSKFQIHFSLDCVNRFSKFQSWLVHLTL